eukprot:6304521-Prymnesium_polylepis.1
MGRRPARHCYGQIGTVTAPSCARRTYCRRRNGYSAISASTLDTAKLGLPPRQAQLDTHRPVRR